MIEILSDPEAFAARAGELLESTIANTVLATVLHGIRAGRFADEPPARFAIVADEDGTVTGAALRTPPRGMLCTALDGPQAAAELIERGLAVDPELPTVNAAMDTARALAGAYRAQTGGTTQRLTAMALHALAPAELREPPRPAAGVLRHPTAGEHDRVVEWVQSFVPEAEVKLTADQAARLARSRLASDQLFVFDDGGEAVSLVGHSVAVAGVPRIGPVYTPPERRSHGYASTAVAALSRRLFAGGAREIALFTDLANPTSNKIYADVGYRRLADYELHALLS